jgi:hypothetical protein
MIEEDKQIIEKQSQLCAKTREKPAVYERNPERI